MLFILQKVSSTEYMLSVNPYPANLRGDEPNLNIFHLKSKNNYADIGVGLGRGYYKCMGAYSYKDKMGFSRTIPAFEEVMPDATAAQQKKESAGKGENKMPFNILIAELNISTSNIGIIAVDSRLREFGAYQQQMIQAISKQWHQLASKHDLDNLANAQVSFLLDPQGNVSKSKILSAISSVLGKNLCE